jgi:hypothetical protein
MTNITTTMPTAVRLELSPELLERLGRIAAERFFIAEHWPSVSAVRHWLASGRPLIMLTDYIMARTKRRITRRTAELLWRLYANQPEPRRRATIEAFQRRLPDVLVCEHCGSCVGPYHVDHVIPLRLGGRDEITNLQVLCPDCNLRKGARLDSRVVHIEFEGVME